MNGRAVALTAYRVMAYITGIGLVLLVCVALPFEWITGDHRPVAIVGMLHGFFYMGYVIATLVLAERYRWKPVRAMLIALAGTIPFVSFVAERKVTRLVRELSANPERATDQRSDLRT